VSSSNSPPYKLYGDYGLGYGFGYGYFNNSTLPPNTDDLPAELLESKLQFQNYAHTQAEGGEVEVTVVSDKGQVGKSEGEGTDTSTHHSYHDSANEGCRQHQYATFDPLENLHKALLQEQEQEKWREQCSAQTTPTELCTNAVTGNSLASLLGPAQVLDYGSSCDFGLRDEEKR
jgi:hypothetical protein